jgi:hypothetical protein
MDEGGDQLEAAGDFLGCEAGLVVHFGIPLQRL